MEWEVLTDNKIRATEQLDLFLPQSVDCTTSLGKSFPAPKVSGFGGTEELAMVALAVLPEDLGSIPSIYLVAHDLL